MRLREGRPLPHTHPRAPGHDLRLREAQNTGLASAGEQDLGEEVGESHIVVKVWAENTQQGQLHTLEPVHRGDLSSLQQLSNSGKVELWRHGKPGSFMSEDVT